MSKLPKGFISSTSQEGQEAVERKVLCVTLLSREWRSSTDRDLSTVNRELAIQLAKHPGVQVSVFLPQCTEDDKRNATSHKVQLIEAEEMTTVDSVDWLINIPEDHAMDCIIGHGVHLGRQIPVIQRSHPCKWIQIVHNAHEALAMYKSSPDAIPRGEKMQQTEIELCELADQVVAIGPKLADTYRRFLRSSEKHQDVIDLTPSIFTEFLDVNQAAEERQTFCVLVIGTGDSEDFNLKGYDLAARAIAELKENSYQLKFVCAPKGKGEEIAEKLLKHDIDRSQLIVRSFNESRETLSRLFCEVDLAIMPSRSEGFGLTALEALSAGLPVLVSGNSGLGEALMKVPNGSNCVVDSEDPKYWASKIKAVREKDRDVRLAESKLLREKYLEKYSWEKPCGVLVEKIQNLVTGSFGHREPPSFLQYTQSPFPAGRQTPAQTYQTSPPQSSSGHGRPRSSLENNQSRFLAGPQTPAQTYQTSHPHSSFSHDSPPSLLEHNTGPQTPVQTYPTSHPPQSSTGYWPSSMEYSRFPSVLAGQSHEGPSYQTWHSPAMFMTGGYSQLPFHAATQSHGEPTYTTSHHPQTMLMTGGYSQLPFHAATQTHGEPTFPTSHHPQKASPANMFDVKTCQRKLAERYQKTAKVPTTAWSSVLQVDLEQIYTRLSWVKQEQTTTGPSQKELNHYTELFTEKTKNGDVAKRILVQGETGIGKTTFVKKLLVDWSNLKEEKRNEERIDALRKFDLVVSINLKEVSKCQTFKEVISRSRLFPEDDEKLVEDLLCYIRKNQDKVLLVFDGYDEYRTSSEAEERYGSRDNSPIFEILHGSILRECTVLVTTRSSRADEIRGPADIQAEITGFNMADREDFIRKMLGSQTEVADLLTFLRTSAMQDLARVPLLSLFFCLLWKEEKQKLVEFSERKAKLYQAIVKHILQHSHRRNSFSKASKLNEAEYEEILAEIGKVALAGLLKGNLVFEFGQLPEKVRGEEGVIVGLFQFSEYGPSLEPMEMVSFIHKSIQEYLAAWYLIYSCVREGNLGEIGHHTATLENCVALENVFQFACGLSDEGAIKVLNHLKSVRISDPTLDLSKIIPDVEAETDVPPYDVTLRHFRFSNLAKNSFREVQSKAELVSQFLDCIGGVILVETYDRLSELMPNVKVLTKLAHNCVFLFYDISLRITLDPNAFKSLEFLNCLQLPLRITEGSKVLTIEDLIKETSRCSEFGHCEFSFILCFRNGQFQFYITKLVLECDNHARLFTGSTAISVPSNASRLCSEHSCLKFLSSLFCGCISSSLSSHTIKGVGAVIGNCKYLSRIEVASDYESSICCLLEQVRNPSKCSLKIGDLSFGHNRLTSVGAERLASLLPKFNVIALKFYLRDCCAAALDTLVTSITHKTLEKLILEGIILTPAATKALGRSLPEMSSLVELVLSGVDGSTLEAEQMEALFGRFNKPLPLLLLTFSGFNLGGSLAPLIKSIRFLPNLKGLRLERLNIDEHDQCSLLKSFGSLTRLKVGINEKPSRDSFHYYLHKDVKIVELGVRSPTPAVAAMLGRLLPELSSLQQLELTGLWISRSTLQAEEMEAVFGGFNKTLPLLKHHFFSELSERGCLAPLIKSLRFLPNLKELWLERLNIDEHDQCSLLKSFGSLTRLTVGINGKRSRDFFRYYSAKDVKMVKLGVISLTPAVAVMLGRLLPELSSLQDLTLIGTSFFELTNTELIIVQAEVMEALFGGFNKTVPLYGLTFMDFNARGCLFPLFRSFRFFPNLVELELNRLNMNEHDLRGLLESFQFIPNLKLLDLSRNPLGHAVTSLVPPIINLKRLVSLCIDDTGCSVGDFNYVRDTAKQALPELYFGDDDDDF